MNDGKICVSVCAETADEFIENIKRAAEFADIIELRFDCLNKDEFNCLNLENIEPVLNKILDHDYEKPLILTFRPKEQGGKHLISNEERNVFWYSGYDSHWGDFEEDIVENSWDWLWDTRIASFHDLSGVPENLDKIYKRLKTTGVDVIKIAIQAGDVCDSIPIWKLLERANFENKKFIPIAMGASGVWTRILGLAHGALMTYAALDEGKETADGQLTAKDLIETYRVKELNANTEIYGIIGGNLSYTLSPFIHNAAFKFHDLNAVYIPFEVRNLDDFFKNFLKEVRLNFKGFSVTIPHKQAIIEYLDEVDETAKAIGAVNTVKIENGKLIGLNTDAEGFVEPLKKAHGNLNGAKVAVFGAGGAARACVYALKKERAEVTIFARGVKKVESLAKEFGVKATEIADRDRRIADFDIIVNATPLGTKGALENETILTAEQLRGAKLIYDLVYNPMETRLMREAKRANVPTIGGIEMLLAQGAKQFEIWTQKSAPIEEMKRAALSKLQKF